MKLHPQRRVERSGAGETNSVAELSENEVSQICSPGMGGLSAQGEIPLTQVGVTRQIQVQEHPSGQWTLISGAKFTKLHGELR